MKFKTIPTVVYLILLPVLLSLGFWQLDRSEQKRALISAQENGAVAQPVRLSSVSINNDDDLRYRKTAAEGHFDNTHQFLLDNQISEGKAGYFVLTPFVLTEGEIAVLVNRGWIPLTPDRSILPDLTVTTNQITITGRINHFPSVGIKLAGAEIPSDSWPATVQIVDHEILANKLGTPLFPFQVELDKALPNGFKREWKTTAPMPPEQHVAYAVQWFALALTLTILFFWYSFKHNDAESKK